MSLFNEAEPLEGTSLPMNAGLLAKLGVGAALIIGLWLYRVGPERASRSVSFPTANVASAPETSGWDSTLAQAYQNHSSGVLVEGEGTVLRLLADDHEGSRHQRFLVRLASGQTILIAYNLDLAPRIEELEAGKSIAFRGDYEWNERGGVVHWTHRDPLGRHEAGWIRYGGRKYQ
jgi:hypothetical protein